MSYSNPYEELLALCAKPDAFLKLSLSSKKSHDSVELPSILCLTAVRSLFIWWGGQFGEVKLTSEGQRSGRETMVILQAGESIKVSLPMEDLAECKEFFFQTLSEYLKSR